MLGGVVLKRGDIKACDHNFSSCKKKIEGTLNGKKGKCGGTGVCCRCDLGGSRPAYAPAVKAAREKQRRSVKSGGVSRRRAAMQATPLAVNGTG